MAAGRAAKLTVGANQHAQICAPSQSDAAAMLNVSRRSVQTAREVLDHGAPELVATVEAGKVAVSTAADIARAPAAEQRKIVAMGEPEILAASKRIRGQRAEARRVELVAVATKAAPRITNECLVVQTRPPRSARVAVRC